MIIYTLELTKDKIVQISINHCAGNNHNANSRSMSYFIFPSKCNLLSVTIVTRTNVDFYTPYVSSPLTCVGSGNASKNYNFARFLTAP